MGKPWRYSSMNPPDYHPAPRFHRSITGHRIGWEIYHWRTWFLTLSIGDFELQLNRWGAL